MSLLILGLAVFFAIHLVPTFPNFRQSLIAKVGVLPYKGVFALISIAAFIAIVQGKAMAPFIEIWQPPYALSVATKLLMLPALIFLVAAYVPCNIKIKLKHPMLIGVKTWALAHLLINGDLASILLFGGFLAYAVIAMISANKRAASSATAKADPERKPIYMDIIVLLIGGAAYAGIGMHHMQLFGVPIH